MLGASRVLLKREKALRASVIYEHWLALTRKRFLKHLGTDSGYLGARGILLKVLGERWPYLVSSGHSPLSPALCIPGAASWLLLSLIHFLSAFPCHPLTDAPVHFFFFNIPNVNSYVKSFLILSSRFHHPSFVILSLRILIRSTLYYCMFIWFSLWSFWVFLFLNQGVIYTQ